MKNITPISLILAIILLVVYCIVSFRFTFYGLGIFLAPVVLLIGALLAFIPMLFPSKQRYPWWLVFGSSSSFLFIILLIIIGVDNYKPTFYIYVPEGFEGMVYLLPAKTPSEELTIDQHGIGYYRTEGEANVKVMQGDHDISDALNQYGRRSLTFPLSDSLNYRAIEITCFEVVNGRVYGSSPWNQPHATCMDEEAFIQLLKGGIIDSTRIVQRTYPNNP